MNTALWTATWLLATVMLAPGAMKLTKPKDQLLAAGMGTLEPFTPTAIKLLGALEVAAAIGLILPALTGIAPILVPLAAVGVALLMIGAMIAVARRGEHHMIALNAVLMLMAAGVAWGRFGPYAIPS